ncbi:MAG: hypothetical protein IPM25_13280 [Chloracidobacterium sp.]|nr:hypothetical protein [Chloracidobacterium sp.]
MKHVHRLSWLFLILLALSVHLKAQEIEVDIETWKGVGNYMPGVKVEIGSYSTTTDHRGKGKVRLPPGNFYFVRATAPCQLMNVAPQGNIVRAGGTDREPIVNLPAGNTGTRRLSFLFRCETDTVPGMVRVKIATRSSCTDAPNVDVKMQSGVSVRLGDKTYVSDENGVIDIDVPPGEYPIIASWQDSVFGYVAQNGLRQKADESGRFVVRLSGTVETLEARLLTCGPDGREKVRAEIAEISSSGRIDVVRSNASGKGFIGMQLRDGDTVTIRGVAKLKWLGRGTISFDAPTGVTVIRVGPDVAPPKGNKAIYRPGFIDFIKGAATFFLPPGPDPDAPLDENGNIIPHRIWGKNAKIFIKGTTFKLSHDDPTQKMTVSVIEGVVEVEPNFEGQHPFELTTGQRAEIGPNGVVGAPASPPGTTPASASPNRSLVRPTKTLFAPGEEISVEYFNANGSGWDWVVIVDPAKPQLAMGPNGSINNQWAFRFDINDNSAKERSGMARFPALPEGSYEARYISWAGGNNTPIASEPFKVGNAPAAPPTGPGGAAPPTTGGNSPGTPATPPPAAPRWNLTGLWRNPGGEGVYRVRQIDAKVVWGLDATSFGSVANMFQGQMFGDNIDGVWEDLPGSPTIGGGRMLLKVESECRFVRVSSVNQYGADVWVKKDSPCDRQGGGAAGSPVTALGPLSGLWRNPGGDAIYRFRHVGSKLHWGVDAVPIRSFANTFQGEVSGTTIEGSWVDLPGSPAISGGKLTLKIESECRIVKTGEAGHYAAHVWVRKDSLCDVTGMQQKTAQPPATSAAPPKVAQIPDDAGSTQPAQNSPPVVVISDPAGVFADKPTTAKTPPPKVAQIPDNRTAASKPPAIAQIPDDRVITSPPPVRTTPPPARTTPARTQPAPKPASTPAPKKEGPGFLEKLAGAINQAVTQQQQQQPPPGGTTQQPQRQPAGTCRGGAYWIGAPTPPNVRTFQIPWSSPFGTDRHHFRVYRAGTGQIVTDNDQPQNANACGMSWHFSLPPGQYDIYLFPGTFANTRSTSTRPVAGPIRVIVN